MATSTYSDTTSGVKASKWTLLEINPGVEYSGDPTDPATNQKRNHHVLIRKREMSKVNVYNAQEGQIGIGAEVHGWVGLKKIYPLSTDGYLCTDDRLEVPTPGVDLYTQVQVWEHIGAWTAFDVADLV